MQMKKVILDTSGYSRLFKGDRTIQTAIEEASTIYLSVVVIGELLAGFKNGLHEERNKQILKKFILKPSVSILPVNEETADIYAKIIHLLKKQGTPIPVNDIWIAANAIEIGAVVITHDLHFLKIPQARVWDNIKAPN